MPFYKIYAGLGGGYGDAKYQYTAEFNTEGEAETAAYVEACQLYDSYDPEGWENLVIEAEGIVDEEDYDDIVDYRHEVEQEAERLDNEYRETWVDYYVVEVDDLSGN